MTRSNDKGAFGEVVYVLISHGFHPEIVIIEMKKKSGVKKAKWLRVESNQTKFD